MPSNKQREEMTTMHNNEQQHTTTRTNKEQRLEKKEIKAYTNMKHAKH
jgi:hypothetical protein